MQLTLKKGSLLAFTSILLLGSSGCASVDPPPLVFQRLVEPFVFDALALTPIEATLVGYHEHPSGGHSAAGADEAPAGGPVKLDELLDDYSPEGSRSASVFTRTSSKSSTRRSNATGFRKNRGPTIRWPRISFAGPSSGLKKSACKSTTRISMSN
jgi:hypothetical protein